jgi:exodeoxyribonuclease V alpha subunit
LFGNGDHIDGAEARSACPRADLPRGAGQCDDVSGQPLFGREVEYAFGELDTLIPAYATTIHKSQGSEYLAVVITLAMQHYNMLARNLLYTAVT